jgi:phosphoribosylformylglycinamidine cyclo-ligase
MSEKLSYTAAGVNIDVADAMKREMAKSIDVGDTRVLNRLGAFASLVEGQFVKYKHPVLVLKTEEPGSKQKLAFQYGRISSIGYDLINHLINDIAVMGAEPLYVQDCVICGKIEPEVVKTLVSSMSSACQAQGCVLVGGETSEQPGVVDVGLYVLSANIVGVVDKECIIDGSKIIENDIVLAVASNGLHTNGYSLVRALMEKKPTIIHQQIDGESFLEIIMRPHKCYFQEIRDLFHLSGVKGFAHITGGGIEGNLNRILPPSMDANINRNLIKILPIFKAIRDEGSIADHEMLRTFNMGVGMTIVCAPDIADDVVNHLERNGCECYPIGKIVEGTGKVKFDGNLAW